MILRVAWRVVSGQGAEDTRSDDEEDDDDDGAAKRAAALSVGLRRTCLEQTVCPQARVVGSEMMSSQAGHCSSGRSTEDTVIGAMVDER